MARDPDIDRRLWNWARAKQGGLSGGLGFSRVNLEAEGSVRGYREATIPIDACDADVTDQAVRALSPVLRETVQRLYLHGATYKAVAARERITEQGVRMRVWKAHDELRAWFAERSARGVDERARVERLQRAAAKASSRLDAPS